MRLGIVGSRTYHNYDVAETYIDAIFYMFDNDKKEIVSGGAEGADSLAERYANIHHSFITIFRPNWQKYGKSAGFKRNEQIVQNSDTILAFWDGHSKGTANTIDHARRLKIPTFIVYF